ncbi:ABC transporter substrate-binding protein [Knoellia sp. p5-6-4]|uniref:ABC transporter substrate-binding protein n=1 Tax=unclassified Knoellia TaxID=2618719 RepID=UPI0023DA2B6D|nr:ABC transporter substrate-binding protein [Knoellia sp. p5-6-4]MDF2144907.1 ABC transporter substrate-binding protein [Knoellia sp. p5-6-4]
MQKFRPAMPVRTVVLGAAVVTSLALAGCSGGSSGASGGKADGPLVFGISADPTQTVPWLSTSTQSVQVLGQIYSTLLNTDASLQPVAGLADLPKISDDGLTYTFTLKKDLKFGNGSALDSEDVKYTFDTIMDPATKATSASYFASVKGIEAPDPQTVVVTLKAPDASFVSALSNVNTSIVPSDVPVDSLTTKPVGSGPYLFESRTPNQSITLKANPDYYQGKPGLAGVQFRVIADEKAMVSALRSGAVDMAVFDNSVTAKTATADNVKVSTVDQLSYHVLQLRADAPALKDVNVRLAISCAIDRKQVLDTAALGAGKVTGPVTSPAYRSDPDSRPCPQRDLAQAREHLGKAGKSGGLSINMITSQGLYSTAVNEAQNIQAQLKEVGIEVKLETLDSNAYVQRWLAGDFDTAIALNGGSTDPNTMYARYFTSTGSFNKVAGYRSATLDKLFAEGKATTDTNERKAVYAKVSQELEDNAAWVWTYTGNLYVAANTAVKGFEPRTNGDLSTLWKATKSAA